MMSEGWFKKKGTTRNNIVVLLKETIMFIIENINIMLLSEGGRGPQNCL